MVLPASISLDALNTKKMVKFNNAESNPNRHSFLDSDGGASTRYHFAGLALVRKLRSEGQV